MKRKDFLRWLGIGGAGTLGAVTLNKVLESGDPSQFEICSSISSFAVGGASQNRQARIGGGRFYGSMVHPPSFIKEGFLSRFEFSKNNPATESASKNKSFEFHIEEIPITIAHETTANAWAFNGQAPGPVIRCTLGDNLTIRFRNTATDLHSMHFHGSHDPAQDGWEPVEPGGEALYKINANPIGFHPYHCHVPPISKHLSKGLYGAMIVDPPRGRPPAHEFLLMLSGWDLKNRGKNDIYTWNGIAGYYDRFPIKVPVGEKVRFYIMNLLEYESPMTFHLHGQTFDIFRTGTKLTPTDHSDVVTLGQTERAILEFILPKRGRYMFHPHQSHMAEAGAMGWIVAV